MIKLDHVDCIHGICEAIFPTIAAVGHILLSIGRVPDILKLACVTKSPGYRRSE